MTAGGWLLAVEQGDRNQSLLGGYEVLTMRYLRQADKCHSSSSFDSTNEVRSTTHRRKTLKHLSEST